MENLDLKLRKIKENIQAKEKADRILKAGVRKVLLLTVGDNTILDEFYLKAGKLILQAKNKPSANELFLKKEMILNLLSREMPTVVIKEMIVR